MVRHLGGVPDEIFPSRNHKVVRRCFAILNGEDLSEDEMNEFFSKSAQNQLFVYTFTD